MEPRKRISLLLSIVLVSSILVVIASTLGRATDSSPVGKRVKVLRRKDQLHIRPSAEEIAAGQDGQRERTFKTRDFKDNPIAVRRVGNLNSDTWHKDLEIEVKNVSAKPIYFMLAYLVFPDWPPPASGRVGVPIPFGERKYIDFNTIADPRDPHLNPGETLIFRIPEKLQKGLRVKHERDPEVTKRLEFDISTVSFGDGTGFVAQRLRDWRIKRAHYAGNNHHASGFKDSVSVRSPPQDGCGPSACARYELDPVPYQICYGINPQTGRPDTCDSTLVIDNASRPCSKAGSTFFDCDNDSYPECRDDFIYDSPDCPGFVPTPTPSPSPSPSPASSPSPSPSPTCDQSKKPNNTNCQCVPLGDGTADWFCGCEDGSIGADHYHISQNQGCPPDKYNDAECCRCINQNHTCPSYCTWNPVSCECVNSVYGTPCSQPTPTPSPGGGGGDGGGGGGGGGGGSCTEYWWVLWSCPDERGQVFPQDFFATTAYAAEGCPGGTEIGRWYAGCW